MPALRSRNLRLESVAAHVGWRVVDNGRPFETVSRHDALPVPIHPVHSAHCSGTLDIYTPHESHGVQIALSRCSTKQIATISNTLFGNSDILLRAFYR